MHIASLIDYASHIHCCILARLIPSNIQYFYSMFYNGVFTYNNFFELKQANEYAYDSNGNFTNIL